MTRASLYFAKGQNWFDSVSVGPSQTRQMRVLINGEELVKIMDCHVCQRNLKVPTAIGMLLLTAPEQPGCDETGKR
jgi:hypothetical protein